MFTNALVRKLFYFTPFYVPELNVGKISAESCYQQNNNLSNFSNGIFISNQSLDIITKTGNYCGANISELKSYITPSSWCGIKAYVQSDNAAFFNIITNDNIVINVYRDSNGTYKIYPLALKSDLNNVSNKLMLDGMKTLSVKWTNSDTLEFYVDNTRVFGILAKWSENYS